MNYQIRVENNKILYEENNEQLGYLEFINISTNVVDIIHTFVDEKHRGEGIAEKLVEYAFKYFENRGIEVKYSCSYVRKHKEKK